MDLCKNYRDIIFLGRISNIQDYLQKSDLLIVPSLIDSCPNTILEALNANVSVYGANTGGIPELLGKSKYLFEPTEQQVYLFLKNILLEKRYLSDKLDQSKRKNELTFNWGNEIKKIIEGNN